MVIDLGKKTIEFNHDDKVIKFQKGKDKACEHSRVELDPTLENISCLDCNAVLNPVIWLMTYLKHLKNISDHNNYAYAQVLAFKDSVMSLKKVTCEHCGKPTPLKITAPDNNVVREKLKIVETENVGLYKLISDKESPE